MLLCYVRATSSPSIVVTFEKYFGAMTPSMPPLRITPFPERKNTAPSFIAAPTSTWMSSFEGRQKALSATKKMRVWCKIRVRVCGRERACAFVCVCVGESGARVCLRGRDVPCPGSDPSPRKRLCTRLLPLGPAEHTCLRGVRSISDKNHEEPKCTCKMYVLSLHRLEPLLAY